MSYADPIWLEGRRKYWTRPDAYRFAPPGSPEAKMPGWLDPWATRVRAREAAEDAARAREAAEQDAFERELAELRDANARVRILLADVKFELALRALGRKYSPDQPRAPAGNPEGGQWTSDGGGDSSSSDVSSLEQEPLTTARDQPARTDLSQLEAVANDPIIRSQIDDAWTASSPNSTRPQEHGFWISRNETTGEVFTRPFANPGFANSIVPGAAPSDAVAFFHTHPFGPEFRATPGPSTSDDAFAERVGLPGLIRSHSGMYYFGPRYRPVRLR